jgi:hypothetical protein
MTDAYSKALDRAVRELAGGMISGDFADSSIAAVDAMRALIGDPHATRFSVDAIEQVRRDILITFADKFSSGFRTQLAEAGLNTAVIECADGLIVDAVAAALATEIT